MFAGAIAAGRFAGLSRAGRIISRLLASKQQSPPFLLRPPLSLFLRAELHSGLADIRVSRGSRSKLIRRPEEAAVVAAEALMKKAKGGQAPADADRNTNTSAHVQIFGLGLDVEARPLPNARTPPFSSLPSHPRKQQSPDTSRRRRRTHRPR